jgi:hypothetical protein
MGLFREFFPLTVSSIFFGGSTEPPDIVEMVKRETNFPFNNHLIFSSPGVRLCLTLRITKIGGPWGDFSPSAANNR